MKKNKSTRDTWIPTTWSYNGAGFEKNKKKIIDRKKKYKEKDYESSNYRQ